MFNQTGTPLNQFIFFDSDTLGEDGRKVYIDPGLVTRYFELVDPSSHDGQQIEKNIKSLRSQAGGITSQSNQNNATEHRKDCGCVMVTYKVLQQGGDASHGDGVYITSLTQAYNKSEGDKAGFHKASFNPTAESDWATKEISESIIPTAIGAIGAVYDRDSQSYRLPQSTDKIGHFLARKDSKRLNNQFSLYYSPGFIIEGLATWKTPEQKMLPSDAGPKDLARILTTTQNNYWSDNGSDPHHWYVFGDGNKLLNQALSEIKAQGQQSLSHHQFHLVDPKENIGILLQQLNSLNAQISKTVVDIGTEAFAAKLHQAHNHNAVLYGLQAFDRPWKKFDTELQSASKFLESAQKKLQTSLAQGDFSQLTFTGLADKLFGTLQGW